MQICMWVPYDEQRLRCTLQFILRPQLKAIRILGGVLIVFGLAVLAVEPSMVVVYVAVLLGGLFVVAIAPVSVAWSVRMQSNVIKDGCHDPDGPRAPLVLGRAGPVTVSEISHNGHVLQDVRTATSAAQILSCARSTR